MIVGCQPQSSTPASRPTLVPFPTVTAGFSVSGELSSAQRPGNSDVFNPATAVAGANQPTPAPDLSACPPLTQTEEIAIAITNSDALVVEINRFLSAGGSPQLLEEIMRDEWNVIGEDGFVRSDLDLTGEGQPEIVMGYTPQGEGGTLLIVGCTNRQYTTRYRSVSDAIEPPQLILIGDMNRDFRNDVVFTINTCEFGLPDSCAFLTQLISWEPSAGRFVSLLGTRIISDSQPTLTDIDNDEVTEIVTRLEDNGNEITGPLRTGTNIYDWDGEVYVLSIQNPDPLEFRIQVIQEADRLLSAGSFQLAVQLYQEALTSEDLEAWRSDEDDILTSYALFKLLVANAALGNQDIEAIYQRIAETFPDPEQTTIYIQMTQVFWDAVLVTGDVREACTEVRTFAAQNTSAIDLLNRYGNRSPVYTTAHMCPF